MLTDNSIQTSIDIDAPAPVVWSVLTDFATYPDWNPFIRSLEGDLVVGGRLRVVLQPDGARPATFRPVVVAVDPGVSFTWLGRVVLAGLFDGRHHLEVRALDGGRSRFTQSEAFEGLLVPIFKGTIAAAERAFRNMNDLVRARAEEAARREEGEAAG